MVKFGKNITISHKISINVKKSFTPKKTPYISIQQFSSSSPQTPPDTTLAALLNLPAPPYPLLSPATTLFHNSQKPNPKIQTSSLMSSPSKPLKNRIPAFPSPSHPYPKSLPSALSSILNPSRSLKLSTLKYQNSSKSNLTQVIPQAPYLTILPISHSAAFTVPDGRVTKPLPCCES